MENKLEIVVQQSGLEKTKADIILAKFQDYFKLASEWETKAKNIKVTDASQTADMAMAKTGRLFLREKRIAIEKVRKDLKEQSLREGKAIDGIANVLKALIVPIETHLKTQEDFVKIQEAAAAEADRIERVRIADEEQIEKDKAEAEELETQRLENDRLAEENRVAQEKLDALETEKQETKEKAQEEKEDRERTERVAKFAREQKQREVDEKIEKERQEAAAEKERLEKELAEMVVCPECNHKFHPREGRSEKTTN